MLQPPSEICPLFLEIDDSKCFGNRAVTMVGRGDVTAPEKIVTAKSRSHLGELRRYFSDLSSNQG